MRIRTIITNKKHILIGLSILIVSFQLNAQLSNPVIKFNRTWAYQFELLELSVRTSGTADPSRLEIKLIAEEGDITIHNKTRSWGSSFDYTTNQQTVFIEHKFKIVPLKSDRVVIKAVVQDLQNQKPDDQTNIQTNDQNIQQLESETISINIKPQPDILRTQAPLRDAINLNLIKTEINQGEDAILLIEVFSDDWVTNMHLIDLKDLPMDILSIKNIKTKKVYVMGKITNLFTLAIKMDSSHPGKYIIPKQEVEVKIRARTPVDGRKKVRIETLKTNAVELTVKNLPQKE